MGVNGIYGLSGSGLDIESMVKVGMMSKQNEYDKMYKQQTKATWQKEAYTEVYNSINNFNNSKLTDYKLQSKMNAMSASSNNSTAFTVTANGSAAPMSHKVEVEELSSNAYLMSTESIDRKSGADKDSINLKDSMFQSITDSGNGKFSVKDWDGNTKTVNGSDAALSFVLNDGKSDTADSARTVTMTYEELAGNKSFNDLASAINKLGLNITASYDTVNDTFSLYNKNGGAENSIDITVNNQDTANLFKNLKLGKSENGELTPIDASAKAPKAITGMSDYTGSKSVAELLNLNISDIKIYNRREMHEETTDSDLEAGVKRYRVTNGVDTDKDLLVKTEPESITIDGKEVTKVGDEDGYTRYKKDDSTDILVKSALAGGGVTKYFTMEVATGKDSTTGTWSDKGEENPVTVTPVKYSTQEVAKDGLAEEDKWSTASETSPFTSGQYIDGKLVTLVEDQDPSDDPGIQRYRLADGSGKDILVKTEEVTTGNEKNITINGISVREVADSSLESGVKRYARTSGTGGDILVKTTTAQTNEYEKFIDGKKVNLQSYDTATGIARYRKGDDSGDILVKETATGTDENGNTTYMYETMEVDKDAEASGEWSRATIVNPVTNGNRITKTMYQTMQLATYGADASTGTWSEATETNPVKESEGAAIKETRYYTQTVNSGESATDVWSEATTTNPVTTGDYINVGNQKKSASDIGFSFSIDDGNGSKRFDFTYASLKTLTIDDVVKNINAMNTDLKASFTDGKFSLENAKAGEGHEVGLHANDDLAYNFFNALGIDLGTSRSIYNEGTGKAFNAGETMKVSGTNGKIVVDGREYTNITDNRATIGGVTYTLLDKTETAAVVTVTQDQDSIIDRVKQFVEDYNTMLKELQDKYTETQYKDYGVLTKSQEDAMTKEQVEKWNDKAKSGLLYHDKYIGDIISKMREALSTPVEGVSGKYNSAFNIGIRTNTDQGRIELDEDKLKAALAAEPNSVYEIFGKMGDYDSTTKTNDFSTSGVAQRLGDVFNTGLKNLRSHSGSSNAIDDNSELGNKIKEWQNKMSDFKSKMTTFENLLYKKYDAMEIALQRLAMTMNYVTFNQQ